MSRLYSDEVQLFDAKATTGVSTTTFEASDWKNVVLTVYGAAATATVKIRGSVQDDVDLTSAASATNRWDYVSFVNAQTGSAVAGDTGQAWDGASTACEILVVNVDALANVTLEVTARSAGTITAYIRGFDNQ